MFEFSSLPSSFHFFGSPQADSISQLPIARPVLLKNAMAIFSRIHKSFDLRYDTLFRAVAIYSAFKTLPSAHKVPEDYTLMASIHLSMKYVEIYPPMLAHIVGHITKTLDLTKYRKYEGIVFKALGSNLNLDTPFTIMDELLDGEDKKVSFDAY